MAISHWIAAAVAIGAAARFRGFPKTIEPRPRLAWTALRRRGLSTAQFVGGVAIVFAVSRLIAFAIPNPPPPHGWSMFLEGNEVAALALRGPAMWAGGRAGLFAIDRTTLRPVEVPPQAAKLRYVKDLLVDRSGELWIAHGDGISRWNGQGWQNFGPGVGLAAGAGYALWQDQAGAIWCGVESGAVVYQSGRFRAVEPLAGGRVTTIFEDRGGVLWFGESSPDHGRLFRYTHGEWRRVTTAEGLAHDSVNGIAQSPDGALWFATGFGASGGASRLDASGWKTWRKRDGLAGAKVRTVYFDRLGRGWFGSEYDGIALASAGVWRTMTPKDGLPGWELLKIVEDAQGMYWLGMDTGLARVEPSRLGGAQ